MTLGRRLIICLSVLLMLTPVLARPASAADDPQAAVQALLDRRAQAIADKNRPAYAATIDPQASVTFRTNEMLGFDGAISVPLVGLKLTADRSEAGDLAAGLPLAAQHQADAAYLPKTRREYRLSTYDTLPAIDEFFYTYVKRQGNWFVATNDDLAAVGVRNTPALFDYGSVVTEATPHFLVMAGKANANRAAELGALAEDAMGVLQSRWPLPWSEKIPIVVPDSPEQAGALLRTDNVASFVAFVSYTPVRDDSTYSITAPRVYAQDDNLLGESRTRQISDLTHELTHAASAAQGGPFTPTWAHEGLAEYIRQNLPTANKVPAGTTKLPENSDFTAQGTQLTNAYAAGTSAMSYIAKTYGGQAPEKLFLAIGSRRVTPGTPAYNVNAAFQASLGISLEDFQQRWLAATS